MSHLTDILSKIKEFVLRITDNVRGFFYDSYTGWNKKRVAIASGVGGGLLITLIVLLILQVNGVFNLFGSSGVEFNPDVLPHGDPQVDGGRGGTDSDTGREWDGGSGQDGWQGYGRPYFGDITSSGGTPPSNNNSTDGSNGGDGGGLSSDSGDPSSSGNANNTSRFERWNGLVELRSMAASETQKLLDDYLMSMMAYIERGQWDGFRRGTLLVLIDMKALGVQVKDNLSETEVSIWNQLEPMLDQLYEEYYLSESSDDLRNIANMECYGLAMSLSRDFINEVRQVHEAESLRLE